MVTRPLPATPSAGGHVPLGEALDRSEPLARLLLQMRLSHARLDAISALLPPGLREAVRAGPLDESVWSLLAAHGAAAAKLRQLLPLIEARLRDGGWPPVAVKIRVHPPAAAA